MCFRLVVAGAMFGNEILSKGLHTAEEDLEAIEIDAHNINVQVKSIAHLLKRLPFTMCTDRLVYNRMSGLNPTNLNELVHFTQLESKANSRPSLTRLPTTAMGHIFPCFPTVNMSIIANGEGGLLSDYYMFLF